MVAAALSALAACGKGGASTHTVALGDSGFVVDIPSDWKVESPMKGFYELEGGRGGPQIMEAPVAAGTGEQMIKSACEGRTELKQGTLPGGGYWFTCKGESKMIQGVTTTRIGVAVPKDDKSSFDCHLETDRDPELALGICKSIRKGGAPAAPASK